MSGRRDPLTPTLSPVGRGDCARGSTPSPHWGEGWGEGVSPPARLALALLLLAAATPALAQSPDETQRRLRDAERTLERERATQAETEARARAATDALRQAEADRLAAIATLRTADAAAAAIAARTADAQAAQARAEAALDAQTRKLAPLLPALTRLALHSEATLLVQPAPPAETLAALALLRGHTSRLADEAVALDEAARATADARRRLASEQAALADAVARARDAATALDLAVAAARAARGDAERDEAAQARRVAAAASQARDLRGLLDRLEDAPPPPPPPRTAALPPPSRPRPITVGTLGWPVQGRLMRRFGETSDGVAETGIAIAAAPGARVLAPWDGKVVYAGPFRSLGLLLILACGDGYHVVLAGLDRLDVAVGSTVRLGDPVGTMAAQDARGRNPALGLELRRAGRPIDPEPWLSRAGGRPG
jgi:septal ring factor EnvC (AmiA/AmiB activator)